MRNKSWQISRRNVLRSSAVCMALPWLEAMSADKSSEKTKRFFGGYFPYGVPMPADGSPTRMKNGWFPVGKGKDYEAPDMHKSIMPLRSKVTFLGGLGQPCFHGLNGHKGADFFLTGADILNTYESQTISIDQRIAKVIGNETRFKSLVMSSFGGVNRPYRSTTLSFDRNGRPIPALNKPAEIFRRMFGKVTGSEKNALASRGSIIDEVLDEAKSLDHKLGKLDKEKMDEYLSSVREVEKMTQREVKWQGTAKSQVDASQLDLGVNPTEPREYLQTMYKLIVLAMQTDTTRVATFQTACEEPTLNYRFPSAVGVKDSPHKLSHKKKDYGNAASYITFLNDMHAEFIKQLDEIQEGEGTLLDNTLCFYGCASNKTHVTDNFPIILSGGKNLGYKHGSYHVFNKDTPLNNLFVTIVNSFGCNVREINGSNGAIGEVLG